MNPDQDTIEQEKAKIAKCNINIKKVIVRLKLSAHQKSAC